MPGFPGRTGSCLGPAAAVGVHGATVFRRCRAGSSENVAAADGPAMGAKILLVEDEPSIAENVAYALTADGYQVVSVATVRDAREAVEKGGRFALALLDVGLPDGTGFELFQELRALGDTPVVFLTARASEVDRVVGLEMGADDYSTKPFSPRELCARVRTVLRRSRRAEERTETDDQSVRYGPFSLDPQRLEVLYHGAPVVLTRYEFRLLSALLSAPGRVFSREQLMNRAWEEPEMSLERTVDAHIKSLRAKLRQVKSGDDPIVTHRGFGYSLRECP